MSKKVCDCLKSNELAIVINECFAYDIFVTEIIAIAACALRRRDKYFRHEFMFIFCGHMGGVPITKISVVSLQETAFKIDCNYLLWLSLIGIDGGVVYTELVRFRELVDE